MDVGRNGEHSIYSPDTVNPIKINYPYAQMKEEALSVAEEQDSGVFNVIKKADEDVVTNIANRVDALYWADKRENSLLVYADGRFSRFNFKFEGPAGQSFSPEQP